jgi:hypothetical protein
MCARISVAADPRKSPERFEYCVRCAQIALSQVLSSAKSRAGQGVEGQTVGAQAMRTWIDNSTVGVFGSFRFSRALLTAGCIALQIMKA